MKKIVFLDKLNALNLKLLNKLTLDKKKLPLVIIFVLIIVYLDYAFIINLQAKGLKARQTKITKLKKDIDAINKTLARIKDTESKPTQAPKIKEIVTEEKITSLLRDISDIANKNNVKLIQIKPSRGLKEKTTVAVPAQFSTLAIMLDLSCNYSALNNFINALENDRVLFIVGAIKISPDPKSHLQHNVNLALETYVKK